MDSGSTAARVEATIRGRVQGVGFRFFVADRAQALGLTGWVKNDRDGTVHCLAEGPRQGLEALVAALELGPPGARVDSVSPAWSAATGAFDRFSITSGWLSGD